jgi:phosphoglycolate phosphatase
VQTPDHNRGKPDPQMIETAMEKAGMSRAETVMIGDTVHDMRMAKAAGVGALGVAWGYHTVFDLDAAGADLVVEDFAQLDRAIDELTGTRGCATSSKTPMRIATTATAGRSTM